MNASRFKTKWIENAPWKIKSIQRNFYVIENLKNKNDVRRLSFKGWEQAPDGDKNGPK